MQKSKSSMSIFLLSLLLGSSVVMLTGCDEGPLEETGEEIDDAVDDAEDEL